MTILLLRLLLLMSSKEILVQKGLEVLFIPIFSNMKLDINVCKSLEIPFAVEEVRQAMLESGAGNS